MRQIPDLLRRINSISILCMHDPRIIEHDIHAAPVVKMGHSSRDGALGADIAFDGFDTGVLGKVLVYFGEGLFKSGFGDVGHEDGSAFAGEEDGCFEADTTG